AGTARAPALVTAKRRLRRFIFASSMSNPMPGAPAKSSFLLYTIFRVRRPYPAWVDAYGNHVYVVKVRTVRRAPRCADHLHQQETAPMRQGVGYGTAPQPGRLQALERLPTLTERVLDAIIQAVTDRLIPFGSRLVEAEIARDLNVSRVPVREALRALEQQGIVVNVPSRGMCLMEVDDRKLREILEIRVLLEERAVLLVLEELAAGRTSLDGLAEELTVMERASQSNSASEMAAADIGFHRALLAITGNATLQSLWETLARQFQMIVGLAWSRTDPEHIFRQHAELLRLIDARDPEALLPVMREHILEGVGLGLFGLGSQRGGVVQLPIGARSR
ncbi:MAG: GntR family transcriptional regulator, partial [Roseomonas sp.]|nr:GntR family transcriptional regulator [Roseomonas sp.]